MVDIRLSVVKGAKSIRSSNIDFRAMHSSRRAESQSAGSGRFVGKPEVTPDQTIRTGGLSSRKRGFWKLPKILGRSLSPGFSGQAIEFLHILRIGIGPALLSERGK